MAENQGVNGDAWNNRAVALLNLLGWDHIGDKNMDLPGSDDKEYGVDALVCYDSPSMNVQQSCIVESKRYSVNSIKTISLRNWVDRLRIKLDALYQSNSLAEEFPRLEDCCSINMGVIMCWLHDVKDEQYFDIEFSKQLDNALINTMPKTMSYKRIFVLTNPRIVRLCAIAKIVEEGSYSFVYPSQIIKDRPLVRSKVLSIEYAMSNIIFAEQTVGEKKNSVVFYLGRMNLDNLRILKESLTLYNLIEEDKDLIIYHYDDDETTRTIIPDVRKEFGMLHVDFKALDHYDISKEPSILKNYRNE